MTVKRLPVNGTRVSYVRSTNRKIETRPGLSVIVQKRSGGYAIAYTNEDPDRSLLAFPQLLLRHLSSTAGSAIRTNQLMNILRAEGYEISESSQEPKSEYRIKINPDSPAKIISYDSPTISTDCQFQYDRLRNHHEYIVRRMPKKLAPVS